jgi:hypothetical protein
MDPEIMPTNKAPETNINAAKLAVFWKIRCPKQPQIRNITIPGAFASESRG